MIFSYKKFLDDNNISLSDLPDNIQDLIKSFRKLQSKWDFMAKKERAADQEKMDDLNDALLSKIEKWHKEQQAVAETEKQRLALEEQEKQRIASEAAEQERIAQEQLVMVEEEKRKKESSGGKGFLIFLASLALATVGIVIAKRKNSSR